MVKTLKLFQPKRQMVARPREFRESRHDRGYDSVWSRRSARHRHKFPVCDECERRGFIVPVDVVDHKIPVRCRPDLRLDPKNWWSLCHFCHQGMKKRMEAFAIATGQVDKLQIWCDDPSTRPPELQYAVRKAKTDVVVV